MKLTYEDFKKSVPTKEQQAAFVKKWKTAAEARHAQQAARVATQLAARAPYVAALREVLGSHRVLKESAATLARGNATGRGGSLRAFPNPPRLPKRIFKSGSCKTIVPPTSEDPYIAEWSTSFGPVGAGNATVNPGTYPFTKDPPPGAVLVNASGGEEDNTAGSGSASVLIGGLGYGTPPSLPAGQFGQVIVSADPTIKYQAIQNDTSFAGLGGGSGLSAGVSVAVQLYNADGSLGAFVQSAATNIILPNTIYNTGDAAWTPDLNYPVSGTFVATSGQSASIYVVIDASAWGSGKSTGAWDFVGNASIEIAAVVSSITVEVQEWVAP